MKNRNACVHFLRVHFGHVFPAGICLLRVLLKLPPPARPGTTGRWTMQFEAMKHKQAGRDR